MTALHQLFPYSNETQTAANNQVGCITYRPPYNFVRIAFIIYLFIRWSVVFDRSPIVFVQIFFLYLFIRWAVSNTDHLIILLKLPLLLFIIYLFFLFRPTFL